MNISTNNLAHLTNRVRNLPYKLRRELLKIPALHAIKEQSYQKALDRYAQFLPQLDESATSILQTLRREGTCVVPLENFELL